jgi:hypothetical protein
MLEDMRDTLVVIVSGYGDPMDDMFSYNLGLPSRFPHHFVFEDFEYSELHAILRGMLSAQRYRAESAKPLRIAARRLAAGRGAPGFGNGRAVRSFLEAAVRRQQERLAAARQERLAAARQERGGAALLAGDAVNVLTSADLLGPCKMPEQLSAVAELEAMVGLGAVKRQVRALCALMADNLRREADEEPPLRISLNRLFLGCVHPLAYACAHMHVHILELD